MQGTIYTRFEQVFILSLAGEDINFVEYICLFPLSDLA
jgi:hypothetical protein